MSFIAMYKLFVLLFSFASCVATAQSVKSFNVKVGVGYATPVNTGNNADNIKGGFVYSIEPQYRIINNVDIGLRFEQAFIQRYEGLDKVISFKSNAKSFVSGLFTATYSVKTAGSLKPFIGLGTGMYLVGKSEQVYGTPNQKTSYPLPATKNLGGMARIGVKFSWMYLEADYNLIGDTSVTNYATGLTVTARNSYASLKAGITIGGNDR